ncbi:MAG: hypothetical protein ABIC39_05795 [Pseudomonadota bacterium]
MEYKEIICLANSIKINGRCIAGKDTTDHDWIRPVSESYTGELSKEQIIDADGKEPDLLDILRIPIKSRSPKYYQPENATVGSEKWQKKGRFREEDLDGICDKTPLLWDNSHPDNNRISLGHIKSCHSMSSLLLVRVNQISIARANYQEKKKYRASFNYEGIEYDLPVTDPKIRKEFENAPPGKYPLKARKFFLCISLTEPFQNLDSSEEACCYKLVASIIRTNK